MPRTHSFVLLIFKTVGLFILSKLVNIYMYTKMCPNYPIPTPPPRAKILIVEQLRLVKRGFEHL